METQQMIDIVELITQVIGVASIVAAMTPTPKDNAVLAVISRLIHLLGMNIGKAKNAE